MVIGIDIDDTISNTNDYLIKEALKYDQECVKGRGFKNKDAYSYMEMFYWSVIDVDNFFKRIKKINYYALLEPIKDASFYINKLYDEGNIIIFITKRENTIKTKMMTKKWLKLHHFKYHKLVLNGDKKGEICKKFGIDLFIDNDEHNIYDALDYQVSCILKGTRFNKDENELKRIEDWKDIYYYIRGEK